MQERTRSERGRGERRREGEREEEHETFDTSGGIIETSTMINFPLREVTLPESAYTQVTS